MRSARLTAATAALALALAGSVSAQTLGLADPAARVGTTIANPHASASTATRVTFKNTKTGVDLVGVMFTPRNLAAGAKVPAVVVTGPMLSVKEQTASLYAQRVAELGYITLVFDYSHFGESGGEPRYLEDPDAKAADISSAVTYLRSLPAVDGNRIAGIGICGSGSYMPHAAVSDRRIKAVATIVPFTAMSYMANTPAFVDLAQAKKDHEAYDRGAGAPTYMMVMPNGNTEGAEYYYDAKRGALARWTGYGVSWSAESWVDFHPEKEVSALGPTPLLVVTAAKAFSIDQSKALFDGASGPKTLYVVERARHFDMYDLDPYVTEVVGRVKAFLLANLRK